ncbi:MAG TPA: phenylalanine--tRNA ligase subunit beta, partial [Candidatus Binatia bacterium]
MKFTFTWLTELVELDAAPNELSDLLTMAGLEVESLTSLGGRDADTKDWVFEISVTPNRGDCLSVLGLAREVAALTGKPLKDSPGDSPVRVVQCLGTVGIEIVNPELCPRYSAMVVENVRIGQSPKWMQQRLEACGFRPLNNVVDVTNYVMVEIGQPLHAFDLDRLTSGQIVIRQSSGDKEFVALDNVKRELADGDLLICDGDTPIALAGIMGGKNSEVTAATRRVLLESAHFDPTTIRRTAKRLGLHSEASHRFERGVDPAGTVSAANRAAQLISKHADGSVSAGVLDSYPRPPQLPSILLRQERIERLLGVEIAPVEAERILTGLGLETKKGEVEGTWRVVPPTSRCDLTREADLIEELARLYGYQKIPTTLPVLRPTTGKADYQLMWERRLRSFLAGEGLFEVINLPFTNETLNRTFTGLWNRPASPVAVLNPLVKESAEMRLSLLPGLIENLRLNLAQKADGFFAYHLGKVFRLRTNGEIEEKQCLGGLLYGSRMRKGLRSLDTPGAVTFLDCKGIIEGILDLFHLRESIVWSRGNVAVLHPGRSAELLRCDKKVGYMGESHPDVNDQFGLSPLMAFELDFGKLLQYSPRQIRASSLPRYPAVERDFAVVVDQTVPSQQIITCINALGQNLIKTVELFDEYRGDSIPPGKKSLA